jgi:AbiU2
MKPIKLPKRPKPPRMPKGLKKTSKALESEVAQLFLRWKMFRQLFAKNQERIDLMQGISPIVFGEIQSMLIDEVLLGIARITDQWAKYDKKKGYFDESVVLEQLIVSLDENQHGSLVADLEKRLKKKVKPKCKAIRKHRHKRLAHLDKLVLLKTRVLPKIKLKTVDDALAEIADYVNAFRMVFFGSPMMFEAIHPIDDGDSLILWLKYAFEFDAMCREKDGWLLHQRVENGLFGKA